MNKFLKQKLQNRMEGLNIGETKTINLTSNSITKKTHTGLFSFKSETIFKK